MGGNYQRFENGGKGDPRKINTVSDIDFSGDDTVGGARTYSEGPTTGSFTDFAPAPAYRRAFANPNTGTVAGTAQGGQEISATQALLNRLRDDEIQTRLVDDEGNEIKTKKDFERFEDKKRKELSRAYKDGDISRTVYEREVKLLKGTADRFPDYVQSEGRTRATENIFGSIAEAKDPESVVAKRVEEQSHWFDKNDPKFGPGGFDVHNPGHVMEYQMMYNQLAAPGKEIKVDGKWGKQTHSAKVPIMESEKEELGGGVDPELEMRLYQEKPSGGWDQDETSGLPPGFGGVRRRGGGGGGGFFPGECLPGRPCAAHLEDGGVIMKTRYKDGGVYYMQ